MEDYIIKYELIGGGLSRHLNILVTYLLLAVHCTYQ